MTAPALPLTDREIEQAHSIADLSADLATHLRLCRKAARLVEDARSAVTAGDLVVADELLDRLQHLLSR